VEYHSCRLVLFPDQRANFPLSDVAQNIVLSSMFAHKVFFEWASVLQFRNTIIGIVVIHSVFPFLPLALTVMPLEDIIKQILKALM
jgi:hypothetical protein